MTKTSLLKKENDTITQWQNTFEQWHSAHGSTDDAAHDIHHFRRVWRMANNIADQETENANRLILLAAAYFHDVVNPPKDSPLRSQASRLAAEKAREILTEMLFDKTLLDDVAHAIEAHSFSANIPTRTIEAKILQDADRMEAIGAIGLARVFYVSGILNRPLFHPTDPICETRDPDDNQYAVDHFFVKLLKLPNQMQTETGKKIAEKRAQVLRDYLQDLKEEVTG